MEERKDGRVFTGGSKTTAKYRGRYAGSACPHMREI